MDACGGKGGVQAWAGGPPRGRQAHEARPVKGGQRRRHMTMQQSVRVPSAHLVRRGAEALWEAAVAQWGGIGAARDDERMDRLIYGVCGDPRRHQAARMLQRRRRQGAHGSHARHALRGRSYSTHRMYVVGEAGGGAACGGGWAGCGRGRSHSTKWSGCVLRRCLPPLTTASSWVGPGPPSC